MRWQLSPVTLSMHDRIVVDVDFGYFLEAFLLALHVQNMKGLAASCDMPIILAASNIPNG